MVMEELGETLDEVHLGDVEQRHPTSFGGVVPRRRVAPFEQRDPEVEDHEVVVDAHSFGPSHQPLADPLETGLLEQLADHRLGHQLAELDSAPGDRPLPLRGAATAPDEE